MTIALLLASALAAQTPAGDATVEAAYAEMAGGRSVAAIEKLEGADTEEASHPARLINLAIAHARIGETETARTLLEDAAGRTDRLWLETASGQWADSRAIARKALAMLERGAFDSAQLAAR